MTRSPVLPFGLPPRRWHNLKRRLTYSMPVPESGEYKKYEKTLVETDLRDGSVLQPILRVRCASKYLEKLTLNGVAAGRSEVAPGGAPIGELPRRVMCPDYR